MMRVLTRAARAARALRGPLAAAFTAATLAFAPGAAHAVDVLISGFTDVPDPGIRGGTITFTVTLENNDTDTANNVVLTFALPANTAFVSAADTVVAGACVHDGLVPGTVTCTYPTLLGSGATPTAGPVRTINIVLRTTGSTVTTLSTIVSATTTDADSNPGNNSLTNNTSINDGADLTASMVGAPNPATGGGLVIWTVSGSNLGPNTSGVVTYTTTLPGVLTYVGASSGGNGWSCSAAGQVVTCTRAAQAIGAYPNLPIGTRITGVAGGTVTLNGSISSTVGDPNPLNNTTVASVTVNPGTDLAVTQDPPSPNPAISGATTTFVVRPINNGPNPATAGATVTFPLPAGFTVSSATGSAGWSCTPAGAPATVTCNFAGSLASGAAGVLTIVATTPSVSVVTAYNNITASIAPNPGGPADPNSSNNTAAVNVTVAPDGVDVRVSKVKGPAFVALGANMTSTISVQNAGPRTAASGTITLVDALDPSREQYVGFSGTNWSCVSAPPNVNCTYNAALGIGNAPDLVITTLALAPGGATNTATVSYSGTPGDTDLSNNSAPATVTITAANNSPDILVGISAATAGGVQTTVEVNETLITYTVVVTNKGTSTAVAHDVVMNLNIPGRTAATDVQIPGRVLTNTSGTSNATFTCSGLGGGSNGGISCTQTGGTSLAIGDVFTFTITATRPMTDVTAANATVTAVSSTQGDPLPGDNTAAVAITIDPIADVEVVSKVLAQNPVLAGTNATYTVTLRNNGPSDAANVSLADVFTIPGGDNGFTFISVSAPNGGSCSGLTPNTSYTSGTPTVTCSWALAVNPSDTRTMTIVIRPNWQTGVGARTLANTATVSTSTPEDGVGGTGTAANSKSLTLNINPAQVDLLINNDDTPDPLGYDSGTPSNNDITYIVAETNSGPSLASGTGFTFTMTPPAGKTATFRGDGAAIGVAAANPAGTIAGSICNNLGTSITGPATLTVTCTYAPPGFLANGATQTRYVVFRVASSPASGGDTYNTLATVLHNETDINSANDSEAEGTTVRVRADLSVVKTPSINPVQIRQPFNWSVVVTNNGPGDSQTTGLTDTLPSGMVFGAGTATYVKSTGGSGTCATAGATLTCAFGLLQNGATATVTYPAIVTANPAGGVTQNCATASTSEVDPNNTNNLSICTNLTVQTSSITGTVFEDRDRAGGNGGTPQSAATEPRIAGVTVALTGTDAYGNTVSLTTTTDGSGVYTFANLSPANGSGYTVTETQPSGYVNGPVDPATPAAGGVYVRGGAAGNSSYTPIVLAANTAGTGYNFPEVRRPTLSGFVYLDLNNNNVRDAGTDTAVAGATVRLLNNASRVVIATTTTDAGGAYTFTGLDPFTIYTIEEPLPVSPPGLLNGPVNPGLVNGLACVTGCTAQPNNPAAGTDRIIDIDLTAGADGTLFNFGELATAPITGTVYIDRNHNGAINPTPTDGRLPGVTLTLYASATCSGTVFGTTTSDALGAYMFSGASAGSTYTVCLTQPTGYGNGSANPGTNGSTSAPTAITITNLPAAGSAANQFGVTLGSIAGSVYLDANNDGVRQGGESGIAGVVVTLTGSDVNGAAVSRSFTSDGTGAFLFADLIAANGGGYTVTEQAAQPVVGGVATLNGRSNAGTIAGVAAGTATGVTTVPSAISAIALGAGADSVNNRFGEILPVGISGTVFIDLNNNGVQNGAGDVGLAGVTVVVTGTDDIGGAVTRTLTTSATGTYSVVDLRPGSYSITEPTQPAGTTNGLTVAGTAGGSVTPVGTVPSAISGVVLSTPGVTSSANNFAEISNAAINGRVFLDVNNNGTADAGEPGITGITVTLSGTDTGGNPVTRTTTTDATGNYSFANLAPGTYTVTEPTQPPGTTNGITSAGTSGGTATSPAVAPSAISNVVLAAGAQATLYNFGELGASPDLLVAKDHTLARFTVNNPASYRIRVRNAGELPTTGVYTVTDRLPTGLTLASTPTGTGWTCVGAAGASTFSCTSSTVVLAAATNPNAITVNVAVGATAAPNSPVNNVVLVEGGGELPARLPTSTERDLFANNPAALPVCSVTIANNACRDPTIVQLSASLAGTVWFDVGSAAGLLDAGDQRLAGWQVLVLDANGATLATATTAADGSYRVADLLPSIALSVRFRDPASGVVFAYPVNGETAPGSSGVSCNEANAIATGGSSSCVSTRGGTPQLSVVLAAGQNLTQQSLPVDPSGVVYDSTARQPVAGAVVALAPVGTCTGWNPSTGIVGATLGGYTLSGNAISMTVGAGGFYQFLFSTTAPASCQFSLTVTPPAGYAFASTAIPPQATALTPPGGAGSSYAVQPQAGAPTGAVGPATTYYLTFTSGSAGANIIHNHIAIDPTLPSGLTLSKTGDKTVAEVGDSVRYSVTVRLTAGAAPPQVTVLDRLPAGFTYIKGTAMVNGVPIADPAGGVGPQLGFNLGAMPASGLQLLQYRLRVGVGSQQGDGTNIARAYACIVPAGCLTPAFTPIAVSRATNEGRHTVHVSGGVFATEACVVGKIFVDCNGNQIQDPEEIGIPGVRLVMQDGTTFISDSEGKYSYCGLPPRSAVLKVDPSTLPRDSRLVTSSNRNLGDAGSLWLDLKNGELHRADFIEGSCSAPVIEQVKARRAQGEVRSNELEKKKGPALRFESKALRVPNTLPSGVPREATDSANQPVPTPRAGGNDAR